MTKHKITKSVLAVLKEGNFTQYKDVNVDSALSDWWSSKRYGRSLALNETGYNAFMTAGIESYECDFFIRTPLKIELTPKLLLEVGKRMPSPFWIDWVTVVRAKYPKVHVFDGKLAMTINLYGTVMDYIQSFSDHYRGK